MSAVVDFVADVGGAIIEGVGDVVESVGDALGDAAEWVGDNVIQPILDDPITFIAAAAAYAYGIPGLSFAGAGTASSVGIATTGSRLAQGDDFDDALKAGAMSFATTGATNAIAQGVKTGGESWAPNLYSTADEIAAAKLAASTPKASSNVIDSSGTPVSTTPAGSIDLVNEGAPLARTSDLDLENMIAKIDDMPSYDRSSLMSYEDVADISNKPPLVSKDAMLQQPDVVSDNVPTTARDPRGGYRSSLEDIVPESSPSNANTPSAKPSIPDNAIVVKAQPGDAVYVPDIVEGNPRPVVRLDSAGNILPEAPPPTAWQSAKNLAGAVAETAGNWIWDGVKWVWNNPQDALLYGAAGYALADAAGLIPKDQPTDSSGGGGKSEDRTQADRDFYSPLEQLELKRTRSGSPFDRSQNPYESGLYTYGEKQGEHGFYDSSVYQPVEYSMPITAAQGGSISELNSQLPSYYRYGVLPMAMGGYATGGLKSLRDDGRSDHIPAMLSDGEYVIDAETVALLGNGSNDAGANRLEHMRQEIRKQKGQALSKGKFSANAKSPLAYMKQRRG